MTSDAIRKLAKLGGDESLVDDDLFYHGGEEYFWRPIFTEVQDALVEHLDGVPAQVSNEVRIDPIESLPHHDDLGNLAQDYLKS